jgi:hypothetical protein
MATTLKVGVHAVLLSDVTGADESVLLATGSKVFISTLEPLTVATREGTVAQVVPEQIRTCKGRPVNVAKLSVPQG